MAEGAGHPIDGGIFVLAGAKASVTLDRLSALLGRAQRHLGERVGEYDRAYERVHDAGGARYYLVEPGHWAGLGGELGVGEREADALRRAHAEQLRRVGRRLDREGEFGSALEIREAVVIAV